MTDGPSSSFFSSPLPRVLAHRGLATEHPENTLAAFSAAIASGATYIETDVHASSDGVCVIAHDADLRRVAGRSARVSDLSFAELQSIDLGGGTRFPSLEEALTAFPHTCFNIDIKSMDAAAPAVEAIMAAGALRRVLVTSFSERRRKAVARAMPGVATSASAPVFAASLLAAAVGLTPLVRTILRSVDAVQIPRTALGIRTDSRSMVRRFASAGVEVHFWVVNDAAEMKRLLDAGAHGLVTDRADIAASALKNR